MQYLNVQTYNAAFGSEVEKTRNWIIRSLIIMLINSLINEILITFIYNNRVIWIMDVPSNGYNMI